LLDFLLDHLLDHLSQHTQNIKYLIFLSVCSFVMWFILELREVELNVVFPISKRINFSLEVDHEAYEVEQNQIKLIF
jgi:hypothetical protein